jgi:hypothetical protein
MADYITPNEDDYGGLVVDLHTGTKRVPRPDWVDHWPDPRVPRDGQDFRTTVKYLWWALLALVALSVMTLCLLLDWKAVDWILSLR